MSEIKLNMTQDGQLHAALVAGICSVSAFFVYPGPEALRFASRCSMKVELHISRTFRNPKESGLSTFTPSIWSTVSCP